MKQLMLLAVFVVVQSIWAIDPNYVKTTIISNGVDNKGNKTDQIDVIYTDGSGREVQSKINNTKILTGNSGEDAQFRTTCSFFNGIGNPEIHTKEFISDSMVYTSDNFLKIKETYLNVQYEKFIRGMDVAEPYAYSRIAYFSDPLQKVQESSIPGYMNSFEHNGTTKVWFLGVSRAENVEIGWSNLSFNFHKGFLIDSYRDLDFIYRIFYSNDHKNEIKYAFGTIDHLLIITKDSQGKITQELKDCLGRTVATASRKGEQLFISESEYDNAGNCLKELPVIDLYATAPSAVNPSIYQYNSLGQIIRKELPDAAIEIYTYNSKGLLSKTGYYKKQNDNSELLIAEYENKYDFLNRIVAVTDVQKAQPLVSYYYDNVDKLIIDASKYNIPYHVVQTLRNAKGKIVAAVNHSDNSATPKNVVDLYSYNYDGNIDFKIKIVPGIPLQKITYRYDMHNRVYREVTELGSIKSEKVYTFDSLGRSDRISHTSNRDKELVKYEYDVFSQLSKKTLAQNVTSEFKYTINNQIDTIRAKNTGLLFEQNLKYMSDGKVSQDFITQSGFSGAPAQPISREYIYDDLNRISSITSNDHRIDGQYAFDELGRFTSKIEGSNGIDGYSALTDYKYYPGTNQIKKAKAESSGNDYSYDIFGNQVVDRQKKMITEYDWRNLPVRFSFYNTIPESITNEKNDAGEDKGLFAITGYNVAYNTSSELAAYMRQQVRSEAVTLLSTLTMLYDASGNRVLKVESK